MKNKLTEEERRQWLAFYKMSREGFDGIPQENRIDKHSLICDAFDKVIEELEKDQPDYDHLTTMTNNLTALMDPMPNKN